jgi:hypothetical protein
MNRIKRFLEEPPEIPELGDFYLISGEFGRFAVDYDVAFRIKAVIDAWRRPTWIEFHDRAGSYIRVRVRHIRSLVESTAEQRAIDRRLERAQQNEENADRRPWDND